MPAAPKAKTQAAAKTDSAPHAHISPSMVGDREPGRQQLLHSSPHGAEALKGNAGRDARDVSVAAVTGNFQVLGGGNTQPEE